MTNVMSEKGSIGYFFLVILLNVELVQTFSQWSYFFAHFYCLTGITSQSELWKVVGRLITEYEF